MKTRTIAVVCLVLTALLGGGITGWRLNLRARSVYTDADKIRVALPDAPIRRILWQPAEPVADTRDVDADQYEPRVSADGALLVFVRGRAGANADLYQRRRTSDGWSAPEAIAAINTAGDELGPELSQDGKSLYFYSDRPGGLGGFDIWISRMGGEGWSEPVNLGPAVNSPFNDYGPALGLDGKTLYFSSNRPRPGEEAPQLEAWAATLRQQRTRHDYDLYRTDIGSGLVGPAHALADLNTPFDEGAPAMSPAGDFLYFASDRPGGMGGFDVYRSRMLRGVLQAPEGLGAGINSAANDLDPAPSTDGFKLYFSSDRTEGTSRSDAHRDAVEKPDAGQPVRYALWSSASREVFVEAEPLRAGEMLARLWAAAWPWLLALMVAALLAFGFFVAMRDATMRQRLRQLSLMAKCVLVSLLIHAAILSGLAIWKVGSAIGDALSSGGGTRAVIGSSGDASGDGGLAAQVRGAAATMEVNPPTFNTAAATIAMPEIASAPVMITTAPASLSILPPSARLMAEEATTSPRAPEAAVAEVGAARHAIRPPQAESPEEAISEAPAGERMAVTLPAAVPVGVQGAAVGSESLHLSPDAVRTPTVSPLVTKLEGDAAIGGGSSPVAGVVRATPSGAASEARLPHAAAGASGSEATRPADAPLVASGSPAPVSGTAAGSGSVQIAPGTGAAPSVAPLEMKIDADTGIGGASKPAAAQIAASQDAGTFAARLPSVATGASGTEAHVFGTAPLTGGAPAPVAGATTGSASVAVAPSSGVIPTIGRVNVELPTGEAPAESGAQPSFGTIELKDRPMAAVRMPGIGKTAPMRADASTESSGSPSAPPMITAAPARPEIGASGPGNGSVNINPGASSIKAPVGPAMSATLGLGSADDAFVASSVRIRDLQGMPKLGLPGARLPAMEKDPPQPAETFAQRAPEIREKVLEKTGGSKETERAVTLALEWFKTHQSADGRWSGKHFDDRCGKCSGEAQIDSDASMTGMALLCFLGAGHTNATDGPYRQNVSKALSWLMQREDSEGDLRQGETMYSQTIAAVALCEAYAMTRDASLQGPARRAVEFVARGPSRRDGRSAASDTSVLGWQIMAIKSAERAGFNVPTTAFDAARRWLDQTAQRGASGRYGYRPAESPSAAATAEAMFVQQLLGHTRDEGRMVESAKFILTTPPAWRHEAPTHYWYYATLAMFQQQGDSWKQWNAALVKELLANQHQEEGLKGSWDPQDPWSRLGGRVYQTAVCTLSLEVYYRYRLGDAEKAR